MLLANHPLAQGVTEPQDGFHLVLHHAAYGHTGPVCHHAGHRLRVDGGQDQRRLALQRRQLFLCLAQFSQCGAAFLVGGCGHGFPAVYRMVAATQAGAQGQNGVYHAFFQFPARHQLGLAFVLGLQLGGDFGAALANVDADAGFAGNDLTLNLQAFNAALAVFQLSRCGVLADRHACAGRVQQAYGLVGQLTCRNVAVRELHSGLNGFVQQLNLVVLLQHAGNATQHQHRLVLVRFRYLHDLKAACQGRVFFNVLLVLGPGRGPNSAQIAPRQRGFEQIGRVTRAGRATGTDQGVHLVNEQDDGLG